MSTWFRDASPSELSQMADERGAAPFATTIVIEGEGAVDLPALRRAVEAAGRVNPGARVVLRGKRWVDSLGAPPVRAVKLEPGATLESAAFLRAPLDAERGPTSELVVVQGALHAIVFRAHAGAMDLPGLMAWARDVFRAWREESPVGAWSKESDASLARKLGAAARRASASHAHPSPLGEPAARDERFTWKRRSFQGAPDFAVAKVAEAVANLSGLARLDVMVPVDLRRHDRSFSSTANLWAPMVLEVARGEAWEALYMRLVQGLVERRELDVAEVAPPSSGRGAGWALRSVVGRVIGKPRRDAAHLASVVVADAGRVALRDFSARAFQATRLSVVPVHTELAPLSISLVSHGDRIDVGLVCAEAHGTCARAEALLDVIEESLSAGDMARWSGNETDAPYPRDATIAAQFLAQAERTPDAIAVVRGAVEVTYRVLCEHAQAVAHALASRGVRSGSIVGLAADRTEDAVAALLGVLIAGAAYLPIDPSYPDDRVAFMLRDSGASLCLASPAHEARLRAIFAGEVTSLEALPRGRGGAEVAPDQAPVATDLAYVIYTSGSTGRPKGVAVEHRSIVNYVTWARAAYRVEPSTRFALFTSLSFDLSVTSLLLPLVCGASVALFPEEVDHVTLGRVLEGSGVNALKLTPTHLDLIDSLELTPAGFGVIVVGGEQLRGPQAARTQRAFGPACRIVNEYGPTEATVGCVAHVFDAAREASAPAVPIGRPMSNVRIHLLDAGRRPVAVGEVGELYIAGDALARGYLGDEAKTAERFVTLDGGTRAYRTGDIGRLTEDGDLEFLGRTDDQIKVRGHRVEPGEIVAALEAHPRVARAVVIGRERAGDPPEKVLCAYVVARGGFDRAELRAYLEERLPAPLIPSFFVAIGEVPLTVNGKVDVRALPDPMRARGAPASSGVMKADPTEAAVAAIWSEILGVDRNGLGAGDDFHRLGGSSLSLAQMLTTVAERVVGSACEAAFLREAAAIARRPTLDAVCRGIRRVRGERSFVESA